jgi:ribulose-phosphate 3-epimerase
MANLAPSLLSADFANLERDVRAVEEGNCTFLHVDVMDGHFVPNISIGIPVLTSLRKITKITLDTHLMISNPDRYIPDFAKAGADIITVHHEALLDPVATMQLIKTCGKQSGVSIKPKTAIEELLPYLDLVDLILIMTVEPGFGGQSFIDGSLEKIAKTKELIENKPIILEVDGGVTLDNVKSVKDAGADLIVAGSSVFNYADGITKACEKFEKLLQEQ